MVGQRSGKTVTERVLTSLFVTNGLVFRSRSQVKVKCFEFRHEAVDIRGLDCQMQGETITGRFRVRSTITSQWTVSVCL